MCEKIQPPKKIRMKVILQNIYLSKTNEKKLVVIGSMDSTILQRWGLPTWGGDKFDKQLMIILDGKK